MKKVFKWIGIVLGVIFVLLGGAGLYVNYAPMPAYDVAKIDFTAVATPARLERGQKLATMLCADCHLDPATGAFTGKRLLEFPEAFGKFWAPNITGDKTHGIGSWSDADLVRLFRTSIHPSGRAVLPFMTRPLMSDEDMHALVSFLRSDHELVRARPVVDTASELALLGKFIVRTSIEPVSWDNRSVPHPDTTDKLALGKYLNAAIGCYGCHSNTMSVEYLEPEKTEGYLAGGKEMGDDKVSVITANLTKDPVHGLGKWTEAQFMRALREGFRPDNTLIRPPMPRFRELSDNELSALWHYLQTIPANPNPDRPQITAVNH